MRISDWRSDVCSSYLIFGKHAAEILVVGIPARSPVTINREAEPNRVYFLSHCDSLSSDFDHNVASLLLDTVTATFCTRGETLHRLALVNINSRSEEHTSALQSLMRISYAVFCLNKKRQ